MTNTQTETQAGAYLRHYTETHDRESTIRHAREGVGLFEKWLAGREISVGLLHDFRLYMVSLTKSKNRRNDIMSHVKLYINWLLVRDEIDLKEVAMREALKPFRVDRSLVDILDKDQIKRIVVAAGEYRGKHPAGALVLAALATGARRGELTTLPLSHIDLANDKLILTSSKTRHQREFPLELCGVGRHVFAEQHRQNRRLDYEYRAWHTIRTAAGLRKVKFKTFRACFSSYAKSAGATPWLIDKLLAHSASVAERAYDRALVGITGDNAPQWYGCEAEFAEAVERVQISRCF